MRCVRRLVPEFFSLPSFRKGYDVLDSSKVIRKLNWRIIQNDVGQKYQVIVGNFLREFLVKDFMVGYTLSYFIKAKLTGPKIHLRKKKKKKKKIKLYIVLF